MVCTFLPITSLSKGHVIAFSTSFNLTVYWSPSDSIPFFKVPSASVASTAKNNQADSLEEIRIAAAHRTDWVTIIFDILIFPFYWIVSHPLKAWLLSTQAIILENSFLLQGLCEFFTFVVKSRTKPSAATLMTLSANAVMIKPSVGYRFFLIKVSIYCV